VDEVMDKERKQAETALDYLSTTDQEVVILERAYKDLEQAYKETKAAIIKTTDGAMDLRKSLAETHEKAKESWVKAQDAWLEWKKLVMRRDSAERRWEDWRSLNKNRMQGGT
jgi:hypothetical protein